MYCRGPESGVWRQDRSGEGRGQQRSEMRSGSYKLKYSKIFLLHAGYFRFRSVLGVGDRERGLRSSALDAVGISVRL
jgi:hypothetical protein